MYDENARRVRNTWTPENLSETDKDDRLERLIEQIKNNAERKGILDYAIRELELCETYADYKAVSETVWDYFPPTEKQIELAYRLADELSINRPTINENHGSQWFSKYIGMAIEATGKLPPTEKQRDTIQAMQWCPDCPKITAEESSCRKNASEYIAKHNTNFIAWKKTRLADTTKRTLKELYRKVEQKEVSENFLMQYDEETAQKMIVHLRQLHKDLAEFRAEKEIAEEFRQFFIDFDEEQRIEKAKNK